MDFNSDIRKIQEQYPDKKLIVVANKMDHADKAFIENSFVYPHTLYTCAKSGLGIDTLKTKLLEFVNTGALRNNDTIITNSRHYDSLLKALAKAISKLSVALHIANIKPPPKTYSLIF